MARHTTKTVTGRRGRQRDRRMLAAQMFDEGHSRAEVASKLGVSWQSAHGWFRRWQEGGNTALEPEGNPGPSPKFSNEEADLIIREMAKGSLAHGYKNELWTLRRVGALFRSLTAKKASPSEVWRLLRRMKWSPQKPQRKARERDAEKIDRWKKEDWPRLCRKAPGLACAGRLLASPVPEGSGGGAHHGVR